MSLKSTPYKKHHKNFPFLTTREEISRIHPKPLLALEDQEFLLREELRPIRLQLELLRTELALRDHGINETLVIFGSARQPALDEVESLLNSLKKEQKNHSADPVLLKKIAIAEKMRENSYYYEQARKLAYLASSDPEKKLMVVTGGGPGIMCAANEGAHQAHAKSVALSVMLPNEQQVNRFATPELTFQFHYFAIRKMHFLMRAKAMTAFPGGFGTLDELFETLTLMQTEKMTRIPILLFNEKYWKKVINFEALVEEGMIDEADLSLFQYVEKAEDAWDRLKKAFATEK